MKKTILTALLLLASPIYAADVYIGVEGQAVQQKPSLYISTFKSTPEANQKASEFYEILRADLYRSRYLDIKEASDFQSEGEQADATARDSAQYRIEGEMQEKDGGKWTFSALLYDAREKKPLFKKTYTSETKGLMRTAHIVSDDVILKITGIKGIAHTRIAFVNDSTGKKEIYISDYDGGNAKKITSDKSIALLPKWSADGTRIYYTSYRFGNPDMLEINFKEGKIQPFSTFRGLNIPGGVSPDGLTIVMTASRGKDPNIYALDIVTKSMKPLLEQKYGITSSPSWSPDGKEVAFVSDRSGNPQIHILNMETKKVRKLTRMNWCDSPSWSPDGSKIVFSGRETSKEKFNIFVSDLTGSKIVRLTVKNGNNENPVWSPDGRFIAFTSTRNGKKQIFIMDADGSAQHQLVELKGNSYTPAWSN